MPNTTGDGRAAEGPITDRTLDALRTTAALLAALPNTAAQLRFGDEVVLEVARPPFAPAAHRQMPVCVFHTAVVGAHRLRRAGDRVAMRGVAGTLDPSIDWGISGHGSVLPGGVLRLERGSRWWHVAAVPVAADVVAEAVEPVRAPMTIGLHADEDLDVTVAHCASSCGDELASATAVDALLEVIARAGTADLERRLGAAVW